MITLCAASARRARVCGNAAREEAGFGALLKGEGRVGVGPHHASPPMTIRARELPLRQPYGDPQNVECCARAPIARRFHALIMAMAIDRVVSSASEKWRRTRSKSASGACVS
jgi:hypothetical protein